MGGGGRTDRCRDQLVELPWTFGVDGRPDGAIGCTTSWLVDGGRPAEDGDNDQLVRDGGGPDRPRVGSNQLVGTVQEGRPVEDGDNDQLVAGRRPPVVGLGALQT